jgi:hypothetical protein
MKQMIYKPNSMRGHHITNKMSGCGMGSVLLDRGGTGGASSYTSLGEYKRTTGEGMRSMMKVKPAVMPREFSRGKGIGGEIEAKLQSLQLKDDKRRKPQNIKFSL